MILLHVGPISFTLGRAAGGLNGVPMLGKPTPLAREEERSHAGCRWGRLDQVRMSGTTAIAASEG